MEKLKEKIAIGRSPKNKVQIKNPSVSSSHCIIERISENNFLIIDCDSTNGTKVNGRNVRRKILSREDRLGAGYIRIGP